MRGKREKADDEKDGINELLFQHSLLSSFLFKRKEILSPSTYTTIMTSSSMILTMFSVAMSLWPTADTEQVDPIYPVRWLNSLIFHISLLSFAITRATVLIGLRDFWSLSPSVVNFISYPACSQSKERRGMTIVIRIVIDRQTDSLHHQDACLTVCSVSHEAHVSARAHDRHMKDVTKDGERIGWLSEDEVLVRFSVWSEKKRESHVDGEESWESEHVLPDVDHNNNSNLRNSVWRGKSFLKREWFLRMKRAVSISGIGLKIGMIDCWLCSLDRWFMWIR